MLPTSLFLWSVDYSRLAESKGEEILLKEAQLIALADLGYGVLDTAMVETAAYVLEKVGGKENDSTNSLY